MEKVKELKAEEAPVKSLEEQLEEKKLTDRKECAKNLEELLKHHNCKLVPSAIMTEKGIQFTMNVENV